LLTDIASLRVTDLPSGDDAVPAPVWVTLLAGATRIQRVDAIAGDAAGLICLDVLTDTIPGGMWVMLTDPRIHGGTLTAGNLRLLRQFIALARSDTRPFVFILATGGVRLTQPRTLFQNVFGAVPDLFALRQTRLLVTIALGKALGMGAIFFGQGHLRIAASPDTLINLTGPGAYQAFFGAGSQPYGEWASAGHQFGTNHLIQELADSPQAALMRAQAVLRFVCGDAQGFATDIKESGHAALPSPPRERPADAGGHLAALLTSMADAALELYPDGGKRWRTFLCRLNGRLYGLLVQPPRNPDNLIGVKEVRRALDGMRLFRALGVPLVSAIDSPGGDPRQSESDGDLVLASLELVEALSTYPHPKLGLLLARCYGGIGLFTLPRDHGSLGLFALEGARIGIMSDAIIDSLVPPGAKLRTEWETTRQIHTPTMQEMLETGNLQGFWQRDALKSHLGAQLFGDALKHSSPEDGAR